MEGSRKYEKVSKQKGPPFWCSSRFGLAVLCFFGTANVYAQRVNFSVGIVCMRNHTHMAAQLSQSHVSNVTPPVCDSAWSGRQASAKEDGSFAWSKGEQGLLLGAFYWGYMVTQVPAGQLSERFGGKYVYGVSMGVAAMATLLTPLAARAHVGLLIALRVVIGLGEGVCFPSQHNIWSHWAPPLERSMLTGFSYAGSQIGNVITFPFSGFLCNALGWESIFYVFGCLGVIWCIAWFFLAFNRPLDSTRIDLNEQQYILNSLRGQLDSTSVSRSSIHTPWRRILTSLPVWAIIVSNTTANFGVYLILTSLPTYFKEAMNFDIKSNGLFSAIPYIAYWLCINIAGLTADFLRRRNLMTTAHVRKFLMILGPSSYPLSPIQLHRPRFHSTGRPSGVLRGHRLLRVRRGDACCGFSHPRAGSLGPIHDTSSYHSPITALQVLGD